MKTNCCKILTHWCLLSDVERISTGASHWQNMEINYCENEHDNHRSPLGQIFNCYRTLSYHYFYDKNPECVPKIFDKQK